MKQYFSAKELAEAQLPALPKTKSGIIRYASKHGWESQQVVGIGGQSSEYHVSNLPLQAREALEAQQVNALMPQLASGKPVAIHNQQALNERQRAVAGARTTVINAVDALKAHGISQKSAIASLLAQAVSGQLAQTNPVLDAGLRLAKDPRGRSKSNYPSERSLLRWLGTDGKALAPKSQRPVKVPVWANDFLNHWQKPEKPSVEHAYREMAKTYALDQQAMPSIHQVRRFITKMGNVSKQQGRMGARELKNVMPFVRRSFDQLLPGDVYSADGHTFDAEVQHPLHGRPFRPEVTTFIDIATRRAVGYSIDLAESSIAVLDALIDSCRHAVPAILYVDNGSGYCNALLKDESTGVLARLGCEVSHSLPYNSQARGVIERVHKTLWIDGAKQLQGYIGHDMDREAKQLHHKLSRKALRENGQTHLTSWEAFMQFCDERIEDYNNRPHSSLPKITDIQGKRRHPSPCELWEQHKSNGWTPETLNSDEAARIFRPRVTRKVLRGEIKLMNNIYFSRALTEYHGERVQVAFDIHNAQYIWLYEQETGLEICRAEWNANQAQYLPQSYVEQAREKRADARLRRIDTKREEIEAERRGNRALSTDEPIYIAGLGDITALQTKAFEQAELVEVERDEKVIDLNAARGVPEPASLTAQQRCELYMQYHSGQAPVPAEHSTWFSRYWMSKEFKSWANRNGLEETLEEIQYAKAGAEARTL
ncbi:MAG: Mu transposase C-terminal domain-containing protein [Pontibacterium sp.]